VRILYIASEVFPFSKTGGLADVAATLPKALVHFGHEVKIVTPKYAKVNEGQWNLKRQSTVSIKLAGKVFPFAFWVGRLPDSPVEVVFLDNDDLFNRTEIYQDQGRDYSDNLIRFAAFSRAVLEIPKQFDWYPDVLHGNDWQTALTFAYLKAHFAGHPRFAKVGTLFTIHNLGYQGIFPGDDFVKLGLPPEFFLPSALEFYGNVNLLKAGLIFSGILNTVSPTYRQEIQTPELGYGLDGILRMRTHDLYAILNGVDYDLWDPMHDKYIQHTYNPKDLKGKQICKEALQKECQLPVLNVPLLGMISRLSMQKGVDLVLEILDELMMLDLQLVVQGVGDLNIQRDLEEASRRHAQKFSFIPTHDESSAHRIQAGSDLILMPSRYEPCGLNHLYSLRYGTIPIVRKTGGLADTVTDALPSHLASGEATGFVFVGATGHSLLTTARLALNMYHQRRYWKRLIKKAMAAEFSWNRSARAYEDLYVRAVARAQANG
jgi:starch synthase